LSFWRRTRPGKELTPKQGLHRSLRRSDAFLNSVNGLYCREFPTSFSPFAPGRSSFTVDRIDEQRLTLPRTISRRRHAKAASDSAAKKKTDITRAMKCSHNVA